jgi:hypothetical protein
VRRLHFSLTTGVGLSLAVLAIVVLALGNLPPASVRARVPNPPPFDFADSFYLQNGINPGNIQKRVGLDSGCAPSTNSPFCNPEGPPIQPAPPGNWVFDNSNTNPTRTNVRALQTTGGFGHAGNLIYYSIMGFVNPNTFTNDAAGVQAQAIANSFEAYIFPKQPGLTTTTCTATITTNCVKLDPAVGNRRQDNVFNTRLDYFTKNPLGLWILRFVLYTPAAFNTPAGQTTLANLAQSNGTSLDGTPIIEKSDDVDALEKKGLVEVVNRPLDGSLGFPWVI